MRFISLSIVSIIDNFTRRTERKKIISIQKTSEILKIHLFQLKNEEMKSSFFEKWSSFYPILFLSLKITSKIKSKSGFPFIIGAK